MRKDHPEITAIINNTVFPPLKASENRSMSKIMPFSTHVEATTPSSAFIMKDKHILYKVANSYIPIILLNNDARDSKTF